MRTVPPVDKPTAEDYCPVRLGLGRPGCHPGCGHGPSAVPVRRVLKLHWRNEAPAAAPEGSRLSLEKFNQSQLIDAIDEVRPEVVSVWHMATLSLNLLTVLANRRIPVV